MPGTPGERNSPASDSREGFMPGRAKKPVTPIRQAGQQRKQFPPRAAFALALGLFALAAFLYLMLWNMERQGNRLYIHASVAALYDLGGKWLVSGCFAGLGGLFLAVGLLEVARGQPPVEVAEDDEPEPPRKRPGR